METHIADIEEFSELGRFLEMPIRAYSDGMKVRLGVAIVTCLQPDILVLDEAIGAGDAHFIDKATRRTQKLYERARIIVMASHDPNLLRRLCNKAVWLDQGRLVKTGGIEEVIQAYAAAA
jgi:ABC-type polysaccharide/polyol phosphate transport system ATPase subunit